MNSHAIVMQTQGKPEVMVLEEVEIGAPASGAGAPESGAVDDVCAEPVVVADGDPAARDGVIGVSWAPRCSVPESAEHPASSTDAASSTEIRMRPG